MEEILSRDKLRLEPKDRQKEMIIGWKKQYSTKDITQGLGVSPATYYKMCSALGITATRNSKRTASVKSQPQLPAVVKQKEEPKPKEGGLTIAYEGEYKAEDVIGRLEKLSLLLMDEKSKYQIHISIKEV